jgi:hypothetical protein
MNNTAITLRKYLDNHNYVGTWWSKYKDIIRLARALPFLRTIIPGI